MSNIPGRLEQSVACLATDVSLTADPEVVSSTPARSHTFVEIDHEIISTSFSSLPLNHSRRVVVSYKRKYAHEVLVKCLFKLAQKKLWLGELMAGFIRVREMSGKFKFFQGQGIVREFYVVLGKNKFLIKCQRNVNEFYNIQFASNDEKQKMAWAVFLTF